jgi:hypothetical protein
LAAAKTAPPCSAQQRAQAQPRMGRQLAAEGQQHLRHPRDLAAGTFVHHAEPGHHVAEQEQRDQRADAQQHHRVDGGRHQLLADGVELQLVGHVARQRLGQVAGAFRRVHGGDVDVGEGGGVDGRQRGQGFGKAFALLERALHAGQRGPGAGARFLVVQGGDGFAQVQACFEQGQQLLAELQQREGLIAGRQRGTAGRSLRRPIDGQHAPALAQREAYRIRFA